jgi:hypothetical protein
MHAQQVWEKSVSQGGGDKALVVGGDTQGQPENKTPSGRDVSSHNVHMSLLISSSVKGAVNDKMNKRGAPSDVPITDKFNITTMPLQVVLVLAVNINAVRVHQGANMGVESTNEGADNTRAVGGAPSPDMLLDFTSDGMGYTESVPMANLGASRN